MSAQPICNQCQSPIDGTFLKAQNATLHEQCADAFFAAQVGCCEECRKPLRGEFVSVSGDAIEGAVQVHTKCVDNFKQRVDASRPARVHCNLCKKQITDKKYSNVEGFPLHNGCVEEFMKTAGGCDECSKPLIGNCIVVKGDQIEGEARIHSDCLDAFKARVKKAAKPAGDARACEECGKALDGDCIEVTSPYIKGKAPIHAACLDAFKATVKKAVGPGLDVACSHCKKPFTESYMRFEGNANLHEECIEPFIAEHIGCCKHCGSSLSKPFTTLAGDIDGGANVHDECVDAYKKKTRPSCSGCGGKVMDNKLLVVGGDKYHQQCLPEGVSARS